MNELFDKARGIHFWSKVFMEGYGVKAKIKLIPNTIFRVIYYTTGFFNNLVIKFAPDVTIKNRNGIYKCRKGSQDIQVVAEGFERNLTSYLMKRQSGIFVDIGANIGRYTVSMARQIGDRGKVIAIEADPENYEAMLENIKLNKLDNVYAFNVACCDKEEDIQFFMQLLDNKGGSSIKERSGCRVITVHGTTLDNILKSRGIEAVDIVKLDVERAEKEVLIGMKETISKSPGIEILFEALDKDCLNECRDVIQGYGLILDDKVFDNHIYRARKTV